MRASTARFPMSDPRPTAPQTSERIDLGTRFLRFERHGHLAICTIDRPAARNALSSSMYFGIKRAVEIVNSWPEPTALILTGVGDVFAPGGELRGREEDRNPALDRKDSPYPVST
jgi:enoyl-CoA hydratase/carnithine racemase